MLHSEPNSAKYCLSAWSGSCSQVSHLSVCLYVYTVRCTDGDIQLVDGGVSYEGKVEYCIDDKWGTVCDDDWTAKDAAVACSQLGYPREGELNALCVSFPHVIVEI